jgi:hypothetical protein
MHSAEYQEQPPDAWDDATALALRCHFLENGVAATLAIYEKSESSQGLDRLSA